jgi:hypothetical protein
LAAAGRREVIRRWRHGDGDAPPVGSLTIRWVDEFTPSFVRLDRVSCCGTVLLWAVGGEGMYATRRCFCVED